MAKKFQSTLTKSMKIYKKHKSCHPSVDLGPEARVKIIDAVKSSVFNCNVNIDFPVENIEILICNFCSEAYRIGFEHGKIDGIIPR